MYPIIPVRSSSIRSVVIPVRSSSIGRVVIPVRSSSTVPFCSVIPVRTSRDYLPPYSRYPVRESSLIK